MGIIKTVKVAFDYFKYDEDGNVQETQRAVDNVNIDIPEGSFVAVLGHNGFRENPPSQSILMRFSSQQRERYGSTEWIPLKEPELWKIPSESRNGIPESG